MILQFIFLLQETLSKHRKKKINLWFCLFYKSHFYEILIHTTWWCSSLSFHCIWWMWLILK